MVGNLIFQDIKQLWASQHSSMLLQRNGMTKTMCACEMLRSFKIKTFTFLIESDTDTTHISFFHCILIRQYSYVLIIGLYQRFLR